jgi:hypothetical protein
MFSSGHNDTLTSPCARKQASQKNLTGWEDSTNRHPEEKARMMQITHNLPSIYASLSIKSIDDGMNDLSVT